MDRPQPLRIQLKTPISNKDILIHAKSLQETAAFKRMFIPLDLTGKQQAEDKELHHHLIDLRDQGETGIKIKSGKIIENVTGQEVILFQLERIYFLVQRLYMTKSPSHILQIFQTIFIALQIVL
jgi:hypothetical protein